MKTYNVEPTAEAIDSAAKTLEEYAADLWRVSKRMREDGDISRVNEAINTCMNIMPNLRLDLFTARPLRETMRDYR